MVLSVTVDFIELKYGMKTKDHLLSNKILSSTNVLSHETFYGEWKQSLSNESVLYRMKTHFIAWKYISSHENRSLSNENVYRIFLHHN